MDILLALLGASSAGSFSAIGTAANARLKEALHSPIAAAAINFGVGFSILTLVLSSGLFNSPPLKALLTIPGWAFLGGLLGVIFVTLSTVTVPKLGLTTTTLTVVFSQMAVSLIVDQLDWLRISSQSIGIPKLIGIGLLLGAIALTQLNTYSTTQRSKLTSKNWDEL